MSRKRQRSLSSIKRLSNLSSDTYSVIISFLSPPAMSKLEVAMGEVFNRRIYKRVAPVLCLTIHPWTNVQEMVSWLASRMLIQRVSKINITRQAGWVRNDVLCTDFDFLRDLPPFPSVKGLYICSTNGSFDGDAMALLPQLFPDAIALKLRHCGHLKAKDYASFTWPSLLALSLANCSLDQESSVVMSTALPQLEHLSLTNNNTITLASIASLRRLKSLNLWDMDLSSSNLASLNVLIELQYLNLGSCQLTDELLLPLEISTLKRIVIYNNSKLTRAAIERLSDPQLIIDGSADIQDAMCRNQLPETVVEVARRGSIINQILWSLISKDPKEDDLDIIHLEGSWDLFAVGKREWCQRCSTYSRPKELGSYEETVVYCGHPDCRETVCQSCQDFWGNHFCAGCFEHHCDKHPPEFCSKCYEHYCAECHAKEDCRCQHNIPNSWGESDSD